ncbi:MAG: hypothetical protein Q8O67_08245 [Deltaproteobacteria bacterium]|nr:hypothetical protein [Deltaproteobacteria bacterium]
MSRRFPSVLALALLGASTIASTAHAELRRGELVVVDADETIEGNLYLSGGTILMHGNVLGDVVAAGGSIIIDGRVDGDVLAAGGEINIIGPVSGDVRAAGGQLSFQAPIGGDATAAGGDITIMNDVGGEALLAGGEALVSGNIAGSLAAATGQLRVNGRVGQGILMTGGALALGRSAVVVGDVHYPENATFQRDANARISGALVPTATSMQQRTAAGVVFALQMIVGLFALGLLWLFLFRGFARRSLANLGTHPARTAGVGALALVVVPLALGLVFMLGVVLGGWWLALFGMSLFALALMLTFPLVALFVGKAALHRMRRTTRSDVWPMLFALIAFVLLMQIPVIGQLLAIAVVVFGLGALAITMLPTLRATSREPVELPSTPLSAEPLPAI